MRPGKAAIAGLDDPERLGVVRERELREAMRQIGVSDVRLLGYRDSGMAGSPSAEHPRAFIRAPVETVAARLASHIRSVRPHVILTFGPEGLYGHPDHLHMHHVALRAIQIAADPSHKGRAASEPWQTPVLYFAAFPREDMLALFDRPNSPLQIPAGGCPGKSRHASIANHAHRSISNRGRSKQARRHRLPSHPDC